MHMGWAATAGTAAAVAVAAALADQRRTRRSEPDAVGFMPWTGVQAFAFTVALVTGVLAAKV